MSSLAFLVPLALVLGGAALSAFLWSLRSGQYDDLDGAAERILLDAENDRITDASSSSNSRENDHRSKGSETS
ncbi:cbb3-type cytochrome oxidase assembly protein CcoS [Bosea sp. UC22_33]|uniref:cbb3-type cytochrome oxidase assembly protein CcoS n=1 Tax=Bosea sp. UC22_33 TaxID=3350165 RepID=UPI00366D5055